MRVVVRTWNVFHGRTWPESGALRLEEAVRLVTHDAPALVALQEVPLWALRRLESWSGLEALAAPTKRAFLGPLAAGAQRRWPRLVRSSLSGQANALLVAPGFPVREACAVRIDLGVVERRVAQRVEVGGVIVVNAHCSQAPAFARDELERIRALLPEAGPCVVCGDLNLPGAGLPGFSAPLPGIDQVLVRGLELVQGPESWPDERRTAGGVLLSDHAPVEAEMMWP